MVVTAAVVIPASSASALQEIPPINCGIVSCTYPIEKKIEFVNDTVNQESSDIQECVENTFGAIRNILQGTPQPAVCNL